MKNIYIVGFMGTGKTSVANALSEKTAIAFIDLDRYIESSSGRSIAEIFRDSGEDYFRKLEKEALAVISRMDRTIVSCGGGIVIDTDNIDLMKKTGICVCLSASPEEILRRIGSQTHRPLLACGEPRKKIEELLSERKSHYDRADVVIDTTGFSAGQVADLIISGPAGLMLSNK